MDNKKSPYDQRTLNLIRGKSINEINYIKNKYSGPDKQCLSFNTFGFHVSRITIDMWLVDLVILGEAE